MPCLPYRLQESVEAPTAKCLRHDAGSGLWLRRRLGFGLPRRRRGRPGPSLLANNGAQRSTAEHCGAQRAVAEPPGREARLRVRRAAAAPAAAPVLTPAQSRCSPALLNSVSFSPPPDTTCCRLSSPEFSCRASLGRSLLAQIRFRLPVLHLEPDDTFAKIPLFVLGQRDFFPKRTGKQRVKATRVLHLQETQERTVCSAATTVSSRYSVTHVLGHELLGGGSKQPPRLVKAASTTQAPLAELAKSRRSSRQRLHLQPSPRSLGLMQDAARKDIMEHAFKGSRWCLFSCDVEAVTSALGSESRQFSRVSKV